MNIKRIPLPRLRAMLVATERDAGPNGDGANVIRREIERRLSLVAKKAQSITKDENRTFRKVNRIFEELESVCEAYQAHGLAAKRS